MKIRDNVCKSPSEVFAHKQLLTASQQTVANGSFNFFFLNKFIYFWLRWVFVAARGLSLVAASRGYCSLQCAGFSLQWLLVAKHRP